MAAATIIEHYLGSSFVSRHIYGSWWFSAAWAVMVALAAAWIARRKVRLPSVLTLHLSFAVILAGALLSASLGRRGNAASAPGCHSRPLQQADIHWKHC